MGVHIIDHPLIKHKLTILRNVNTKHNLFKQLVSEITLLMTYEISSTIKLKTVEVETPMMKTTGFEIEDDIAVVPVLRAGLGMVEGITTLFPRAFIAHVGMYRDKETLVPKVYYKKFPKDISKMKVFIIDPLLATGGSIISAMDILKLEGVDNVTIVCLIGVEEGIRAILQKYPNATIYMAAKDKRLNEHAYIEPGLGDAGDRLFGTL